MRKFDCERQAVNAGDSDDSAELSPGTWPPLPTDAGHNHGLGGSVLEILLCTRGTKVPGQPTGAL